MPEGEVEVDLAALELFLVVLVVVVPVGEVILVMPEL
jgi:hypothetical protein